MRRKQTIISYIFLPEVHNQYLTDRRYEPKFRNILQNFSKSKHDK